MEVVEKIDFNGNSVADTTGQVKKTEEVKVEETVKTEETTEPKTEVEGELPQWAKDKMSKLEEEKENYKKGMLKAKGKTLETKEEDEEEEYPEWDENSKKFQTQTLLEAKKVAELGAKQIIEKNNEQEAISQFLTSHPDIEDKWDTVISNYTPKNGKDSIKSIIKDLERAYVITRYESGELDKIQEEATKKGIAQAKAEELSTVSKTTSKVASQGMPALSQGAIDLANKMRVDPKKLAEEDDSLTAEIKF